MQVLGNYEGADGVYISWERLATTGPVNHYYITRSDYIDGTYTGVATVAYPINEYVDTAGDLTSYYIITEKMVDDATVATHQPLWGDEIMLRSSLAYELDWLLRIPVYRERLLFVNDERNEARVAAWGSMNYWPRPELYLSAKQSDGDRSPIKIIPQVGATDLDNKGDSDADYAEFAWFSDYNNHIYFVDAAGDPISIDWADDVEINYTFQAISPREMNDAIYLAACEIVAQVGISKSGRVESPRNIGSLPRRWDAALVDGAAYRILRRLALSLNQRERMLVFRDWQVDGDNPSERILNQAKEYADRFEKEKEALKVEAGYPSTRIILTQEMMLPGQRNRFFRMSFASTNG